MKPGYVDWPQEPKTFSTQSAKLAFVSKLDGIEASATVGADWATNLTSIPSALFQIFYQSSAPGSGMSVGDFWVDSDDNKIYRYADSSWGEVQDDDIAQAISDAATAQSAADTAQSAADAAQALLDDIAADAKITPVEKLTLKPLWDAILAEKTDIDTQADTFSVSKTDYGNAYDALYAYVVTTLDTFANMAATTTITRATWDTDFEAYYDEKIEILNAISVAAKALADTAQSTADSKIVTFYQDAIPTSTDTGDLWVDTNDKNKLYRAACAGADEIKAGEWILVRDTDVAQAIADAATAQSTADSKIVTFFQDAVPTATDAGDFWVDTNDENKLYRATNIGDDEVKGGEWELVRDAEVTQLRTDTGNGTLTLSSLTTISGEWYDESGVEIDATHGINIYGTNNAFTTRATKTGTIQCSVNTAGDILAGAGAVRLGAHGINIFGADNALTTRATQTGTIQCSVNSSGQIVAGAGAVTLDSDGMHVDGENLYFMDGATKKAYIKWLTGVGLSIYTESGVPIHISASNAEIDLGGDYVAVPISEAAPSSNEDGAIYYNTTLTMGYMYGDGAWHALW